MNKEERTDCSDKAKMTGTGEDFLEETSPELRGELNPNRKGAGNEIPSRENSTGKQLIM